MPNAILRRSGNTAPRPFDNRIFMTTREMARIPASRQLLALLLILFAGCGNMPERDLTQIPAPDLQAQARELESHGKLVEAAQNHQQLAQRQSGPAREGHLLEAASLLSRGGYNNRARAVIATLDSRQLTTDQNLRLRLIQARIAMAEGQAGAALEQLRLPGTIAIPADLQQEWRKIEAEASAQHAPPRLAMEPASPKQPEAVRQPSHIALLLPLSGAFSNQAAAVRDGFMAAYYARRSSGYTPEIRVYDTSDNTDTGMAVYQQALDNGADFIVGPLHKPLLERIAAEGRRDVATLALNYLSDETVRVENLHQYGLLPEDEARQVAQRAFTDGHSRALALIPTGEWGDRILATFSREWQQLGGRLLEVQRYDASQHDFSAPVISLLDIDRSRARHSALKSLLGMDIKFDGRRRQDGDFIFVATFPTQARQIRPQLRFYLAGDLPVYSTSHTFSGEINTNQDRDLDGVTFCDMPWSLSNGEGNSPSWQEILAVFKGSAIPFKRLYAMGIDAYALMERFDTLGSSAESGLKGESGTLYLDRYNRIQRQLQWARFRNGQPQPAETAAPEQAPQ